MTVRCPICRRPVGAQEADFPFCSERCRLIDLGQWASGAYAIPGEPAAEVHDTPRRNPHAEE
jgi:endogenous inhibitor of DNA gyrase (YacG/DUF329 family)